MLIPFLVFWVLVFLAREELGIKGVAIAVAVWSGLLAALIMADISPYFFVAAQSVMDVVLILLVFGGDITIR